jgi:alpha-beta hydrolase superfamily lysophospholipase
MDTSTLRSNPHPVHGYDEAVGRIEALLAQDTPEVNSLGCSRFMTHGRRVERAIVFWHGFTNCPQQFCQLGALFFERGYNVLIPRMPHHGLADRLTPDQAQLTAKELVACTDESTDVAHGLGEHVTVGGISMGGMMAAWAAQHRADVDLAVVMSPDFGLGLIPSAVLPAAAGLAARLPNTFIWWDPRRQADLPGPKHAYPRFSTHALAQTLVLGFAVQAEARRNKPAARSILVITVAQDPAVDNAATAKVVGDWRRNGGENIRTYEFSADLHLIHDCIDPDQVGAQTSTVYPILADLITGS